MIIDSHCHLYDPAYQDLRETLTRAVAHEVWGVVAVGCDPASNAKTMEASGRYDKVGWACLGCHPEGPLDEQVVDQVVEQVTTHHARIVALGEESGRLDTMLERAGAMLDREFDLRMRRLLTFLEPTLTLLLGGVIGVILVALYLPIFGLSKAIVR